MIVIICEKRDQAIKVAAGLDIPCIGSPPFQGQWSGQQTAVCTARGHLFELAPPSKVDPRLDWKNIKHLDDIPPNPPLVGIRNTGKVFQTIRAHLEKASSVIIATDADREGERIAWNILAKARYKGTVKRAWLAGGLDKTSIRKAFTNTLPGDDRRPWARAAEARAFSDWAWQYAVRAYTAVGRTGALGAALASGKGKGSVVSVGRVQTPTLALIAERETTITHFQPITHWIPEVTTEGGMRARHTPEREETADGIVIDRRNDKMLFVDQDAAQALCDTTIAHGKLRIVENKASSSKVAPPALFNLTDACTILAKTAKISANLAQTVFEDAYEQGFLSYPRTSRRELPLETWQEWPERFASIAKFSPLKALAEEAMRYHNRADAERPHKVTEKSLEHHAIIPTAAMPPLAVEARKTSRGSVRHSDQHIMLAWALAAERMLIWSLPDARIIERKVLLEGPGPALTGAEIARWTANGVVISDPGWSAWVPGGVTEKIATTQEDGEIPVTDAILLKRTTRPPKRYTEATLMQAMEQSSRQIQDPDLRQRLRESDGIGTPATRARIIGGLAVRGYIQKQKNYLHMCDKGFDLLKAVPESMRSIDTTAEWEQALANICKTPANEAVAMRDAFVRAQYTHIEQVIKSLQKDYGAIMSETTSYEQRPASEKQIAFARKLASENNIEYPKALENDSRAMSKFIDQHVSARPAGATANDTPSEKMLDYARTLAARNDAKIPPEALKKRAECSKFIEEMKAMDGGQPSGKAIAFAKKIAKGLQIELPDNASKDRAACSAFIEEHKEAFFATPQKPSENQLRFALKLAEGAPLPKGVMEDAQACRDYIDKMLHK